MEGCVRSTLYDIISKMFPEKEMLVKTVPSDILIYFETIRETRPESVIDIGMMLMRQNVVSRQAGAIFIPDGTKLYGYYPEDEKTFPVYDVVYDGVYSDPEEISDKGYTLMIYLPHENEYLKEAKSIKADYILTRFCLLSELAKVYKFSFMNKVIEDDNEYLVCAVDKG